MIACRWMLALCLCAPVLMASAQGLPKPKEFYFDHDRHAAPITVGTGEGEALAASLARMRERGDRRAREATAQLAHLAFSEGRAELGKALYQQALGNARPDVGVSRAIVWNHGWDLYRSGDYQQALVQWAQIGNASVGGPSWLPPTLALVLWKLDRKDEALAWYAAAVRTEPTLWGDAGQLPALLPQWRDEERAVLAEVLQAWRKAPPSWP